MTIRELEEKRSALLANAHGIMTGANVTAEQRTSVDAMLTDANALLADINRLKATAPEEVRAVQIPPRDNPSGEIENKPETRSVEERRAAADVALRSYIRNQPFERRDLTVLADGIMIPEGVTTPNVALQSAGYIYDLVRKLPSNTGEPIKMPFIDDVTNGFVLESTAITTTDPGIDGVTISIDGLRSNPILIDNNLIADTGFDIVKYITDAIQTRYQRSVAKVITLGNGSNVQGLIAGVTSTVTTATAAKVAYGDLVGLATSLDPAYAMGAAWSFSTSTLGVLLSIVDGNGRPVFLPFNAGATSGFAGTILGFPVKINPYMPVVATANVPVLFGNFDSGYTLREVKPGIRILRLSERYAELNRLGVVAFARIGGAVTDAGTHPVVSLTVK